jgi:hypothetical protein
VYKGPIVHHFCPKLQYLFLPELMPRPDGRTVTQMDADARHMRPFRRFSLLGAAAVISIVRILSP